MGFFDFLFRNGSNVNVTARNGIYSEGPEVTKALNMNEEYGSEISSDVNYTNPDDSYTQSGVQLEDVTNTLRLTYRGFLAKEGSQEIYSVIGYGDNNNWQNVEYYPMHKLDDQTFEVLFPLKTHGNINIAFKNESEVWDNNSGSNYVFYDHNLQGGS